MTGVVEALSIVLIPTQVALVGKSVLKFFLLSSGVPAAELDDKEMLRVSVLISLVEPSEVVDTESTSEFVDEWYSSLVPVVLESGGASDANFVLTRPGRLIPA